jgi:glucose-1-phosphate thymidylyltransferase
MKVASGYLKGLILAGGTGSRLRPFTHSLPKQLLPLANRPVLAYVVESMIEAGIKEIGIVVNARSTQIACALGDGSRYGARFTYIEQDAPRGLAHAVQVARPFLGETPFAVVLGDNFLSEGFSRHVETFIQSDSHAHLLLKPVPDPANFGVAVLDESGRLARLIEKPLVPPSDLAILGFYLLGPEFFEASRRIKPSARGELEITDALQAMIEAGLEVRGSIVKEDWVDTGSAEDLLKANRLVLEKQAPRWNRALHRDATIDGLVQVAEDVRLWGSRIEGPAIIGSGTSLVDSRVGPGTSIGADCEIEGAELQDCIVMDRSVIRGARLEGAIIGRGVVIHAIPGTKLRDLRLGDHARVVLA